MIYIVGDFEKYKTNIHHFGNTYTQPGATNTINLAKKDTFKIVTQVKLAAQIQ